MDNLTKIKENKPVPVSVWRNIKKELPITKGTKIANYDNKISTIASKVKEKLDVRTM